MNEENEDEDEPWGFATKPSFTNRLTDALLDALRAPDLDTTNDKLRLALRMVGRLHLGTDILIKRERAIELKKSAALILEANTAQSRAESRIKKMTRRVRPEIRLEVFTRDGYHCRYCDLEVLPGGPMGAHLDHWEPNGPNTAENLVTACRACNIKKGYVRPGNLLQDRGMSLLGKRPNTPPKRLVVSKSVSK